MLKIAKYRYEPGEDGKSIRQIQIDLRELEKLGFESIEYDGRNPFYHKRFTNENVEIDYAVGIDYYVNKKTREISIRTFGTLDDVILDNTLCDLIKADLVEKE